MSSSASNVWRIGEVLRTSVVCHFLAAGWSRFCWFHLSLNLMILIRRQPPAHLIEMSLPVEWHLWQEQLLTHNQGKFMKTVNEKRNFAFSFNISNLVLSSNSSTEDSKLLHTNLYAGIACTTHIYSCSNMSFSFTVSFAFMSRALRWRLKGNCLLKLFNLFYCHLLKIRLTWYGDSGGRWRSGAKGWTRAAQLTCISQMCLSVWIKEPVAFRLFSFAPPPPLTLPPHSLSGILALPPSIKLSLPCMSSLQQLLSCIQ